MSSAYDGYDDAILGERGSDIRTVQELLGYCDVETTISMRRSFVEGRSVS